MAGIGFQKLISALPEQLTPNTVYFVKTGQGFDIWLSDNTGSAAYQQNVVAADEIDPFLLMGVG